MKREACGPRLTQSRPDPRLLRLIFRPSGVVLRIRRGCTGETPVPFYGGLWPSLHVPGLSDPNERWARASIERLGEEQLAWLTWVDRPLRSMPRPEKNGRSIGVTAILCINMIHSRPWPRRVGLIEGGGDALPATAWLFLYGPYRRGGVATAPSNEAFDGRSRCVGNADRGWGFCARSRESGPGAGGQVLWRAHR